MNDMRRQVSKMGAFGEAVFGQGESAWHATLLPSGDKHEPYMEIVVEAQDEKQLQQFQRGFYEMVDYYGFPDTRIAVNGNRIDFAVPRAAYEEHVRPLIRAQEGVDSIHNGKAVVNDQEAQLRARLRSILFDQGSSAWHERGVFGKHVRAIDLFELEREGFTIEWLPLIELARDEMEKATGITGLKGHSTSFAEYGFALRADDFKKLQDTIGRNDAGQQHDSKVLDIKTWGERVAVRKAKQQAGQRGGDF